MDTSTQKRHDLGAAVVPAVLHEGATNTAPCGADLSGSRPVYECDEAELCVVCTVLTPRWTAWKAARR